MGAVDLLVVALTSIVTLIDGARVIVVAIGARRQRDFLQFVRVHRRQSSVKRRRGVSDDAIGAGLLGRASHKNSRDDDDHEGLQHDRLRMVHAAPQDENEKGQLTEIIYLPTYLLLSNKYVGRSDCKQPDFPPPHLS